MKIKLLNLLLIGSIVLSVMLSSCSNNKGTFTDKRDGKTYKWVRIGEQVWMAENLAYTGNEIRHITNKHEWGFNNALDGWCFYDNKLSNGKTYGVLYQWKAAKKACPEGWHLPAYEEWAQLKNYLVENGYSCDGVVGNSNIAKSLATSSGWNISNEKGAVGNTDFPEFKNKTGFSALPGGYSNGFDFINMGSNGNWWSSSERDSDLAYCFSLYSEFAEVINDYHYFKNYGFSVRCVRDY